MTLRVGADGVRVTVPPRVRAAALEAFLREHRGWVADRLAELPAARPLADGDALALLDGTLALEAAGAARGTGRAVRRGDRLVVRPDAGGGLDAPVERWYRRAALAELEPRARALAAELGREVTRVAVRDPRSRWGSCTAPGRLSFSWRLMLAPERVLDHVVAHEACHLVHPDHSPAFWRRLGEVRPGYEAERAWLREHGERLRLGPAWRAISPV
ncbi:MAG: M48 family metallopeptidase [Thermoleophilia bacterium]